MVFTEVKFTNNPNGVYYSGQNLSGEIFIDNEKSRSIYCITLKIEGFAECRWKETSGSGKSRRTTHYKGREDYLKTYSCILGNNRGDKTELTLGKHKFHFACLLPASLPTSFESTYGQIRYQVKVTIERPWKLDIKTTFGFTVIKVEDLNFNDPALRKPATAEVSKSFFLGFSSKTLDMSAQIPFCGFVSGQSIPVSVKLNNDSSVDVESIKVSLKQLIHYIAQTPRRKTRERIQSATEARLEGVKSKNKGSFEAQVVIPALPPSNIGFCGVLQVFYEIHVLAKVGGLHRSPVIRIPIVIGTVPLYNLHHAPPPYPQAIPYDAQQPSSSSSLTQYPTAPRAPISPENLPPPSYAMAMSMSVSTDNENNENPENEEDQDPSEEKEFTPMYPVFNFPNPNEASAPPSYGFSTQNYQYPPEKVNF